MASWLCTIDTVSSNVIILQLGVVLSILELQVDCHTYMMREYLHFKCLSSSPQYDLLITATPTLALLLYTSRTLDDDDEQQQCLYAI